MQTLVYNRPMAFATIDDLDLLTRSLRNSEAAQYVQNSYRQQGRSLSVHNHYWHRIDVLDESTAARVMSVFWKRYHYAGNPDSFKLDSEYTLVWGTDLRSAKKPESDTGDVREANSASKS